jgi:hypothetical protein
MGLDDAIEAELEARRAHAARAEQAARQQAAISDWYREHPWASPSDGIVTRAADEEMAELLSDAVRRLPRDFPDPVRARRMWRAGLLYRDRDGRERMTFTTHRAWRGSGHRRVRYLGFFAGDEHHEGGPYGRGWIGPSWAFGVLEDGRYAGQLGKLGNAEALKRYLVKLIIG